MKIQELLKSKSGAVVTSIDVGDTIGAAAQKMAAHKIAALVVTPRFASSGRRLRYAPSRVP
jgi:hypothetical protein